jgi:hypothetical protein
MIQMIIAMLTMVTVIPSAQPQEELIYQVTVVTSAESGVIVPVPLTSIAE